MRVWVAALWVTMGCGTTSYAGTATGRCRVRFGGEEPNVAGAVPLSERTDAVTMRLEDGAGGSIRLHMQGCDLVLTPAPHVDGTNPSFVITSGSRCRWDVPGAGVLTFPVQQITPDHTRTDGGGGADAYANISSNEIALVFEAPVARSTARFDCDATRR